MLSRQTLDPTPFRKVSLSFLLAGLGLEFRVFGSRLTWAPSPQTVNRPVLKALRPKRPLRNPEREDLGMFALILTVLIGVIIGGDYIPIKDSRTVSITGDIRMKTSKDLDLFAHQTLNPKP